MNPCNINTFLLLAFLFFFSILKVLLIIVTIKLSNAHIQSLFTPTIALIIGLETHNRYHDEH